MNEEYDNIKLFEDYLTNTLAGQDLISFERRLREDLTFRKGFEEFRLLTSGIKYARRQNLNPILQQLQEVEASLPSTTQSSRVVAMRRLAIFLIAALIALGLWLIWKELSPKPKHRAIIAEYFSPYPSFGVSLNSRGGLETQRAKALQAYDSANYEVAIPLFQRVYAEYQDTFSLFFLGIAQLAEDRPRNALKSFRIFGDFEPDLLEAVQWYRSLGLLKIGRVEDAVALLEALATDSGDYSREAANLLRDLNVLSLNLWEPLSTPSPLLSYDQEPPILFHVDTFAAGGNITEAIQLYTKVLSNCSSLGFNDSIHILNQLAFLHLSLAEVDSSGQLLARVESRLKKKFLLPYSGHYG